MSLTLLLFRHGEIPQVSPRRFVGQGDPPLSEAGRAQAAAWAAALPGLVAGRPVAGVFCSDLLRCRETAELMLAGLGLAATPAPQLREIALGAWEGLTVDEVRARYPGAHERRGEDLAGYATPGGESFAAVQARAWDFLESVAAGRSGVLVAVAHGGVNRAVICRALGMPLGNLFRLGQDYCRLNVLERVEAVADGGAGWRVRGLNLPPGGAEI